MTKMKREEVMAEMNARAQERNRIERERRSAIEDVKVWGLSDVQIEEMKAQVSHIIDLLDAAGVDVHEILKR